MHASKSWNGMCKYVFKCLSPETSLTLAFLTFSLKTVVFLFFLDKKDNFAEMCNNTRFKLPILEHDFFMTRNSVVLCCVVVLHYFSSSLVWWNFWGEQYSWTLLFKVRGILYIGSVLVCCLKSKQILCLPQRLLEIKEWINENKYILFSNCLAFSA